MEIGTATNYRNDRGQLNLVDIARDILTDLTVLTFEDSDEMAFFDGQIYRMGAEAKIRGKVAELAGDDVSNHDVAEILGKIQRRTYTNRNAFIQRTTEIAVANGILDVVSGKLRAFDPAFHSLIQIPVKFVPDADCQKFKKFLSEVHYADDVPTIQEWFGFNLWAQGYPAQKSMMFIGDGGNGKSTEISVLQAMIGKENRASISLHQLEEDRFASAALYGKLSNLFADLPPNDLKTSGMFKMLTGGDPIRAENKFRNAFVFDNVAKLTFSANKVPRVYDDSTAFFRRWLIIEFPNTFEGEKQNPNLLAELTADAELSGILNWALEGLRRLIANNWKFSNSKSTDALREDYIVRSDPYRSLLEHCLVIEPGKFILKDDLFRLYQEHCKFHRQAPVRYDSFFRNFRRAMPEGSYREYWPPGEDRKRAVDGISIVPVEGFDSIHTMHTMHTFVLYFSATCNRHGDSGLHEAKVTKKGDHDVHDVQKKLDNILGGKYLREYEGHVVGEDYIGEDRAKFEKLISDGIIEPIYSGGNEHAEN